MEIPIPAIIAFAFAAILGILYHVFTKIRDQKNNFLRISDELRKPFIDAKSIFDINVRGIHDRCDIEYTFAKLQSDQKRNVQAIIPHIPSRQRSRLQVAWNEYEKQINEESPSSWFTYDNLYKNKEDIIKKRKNLITQLNDIIFFFDYYNMFSVFNTLK